MTRMAGKKKGEIQLYALSTCVWCKKTKQLLDQMGVEYEFVEVDLLQGDASKAKEKLGWAPKVTFRELVRIMMKADFEKIRNRIE